MKIIKFILSIFVLIIEIVIAIFVIIVGTIVFPLVKWRKGISFWMWFFIIFKILADIRDKFFKRKNDEVV